MPLFSLPNELLIQIGEQLEPKDLDRFIRTNRRLAALLTPVLHMIAAHTVLDMEDITVLAWAIRNDHHALLSPLLDYGSDIEFLNWANQTPLMIAAAGGKLAAIRLLIDRGAKIAPQASPMLETALHSAAEHGQIEAAKVLLEKGANIDAETENGETPLYWAISSYKNEFSKFLLGKGADVNSRSNFGKSVLQHAACPENEETFLELCDKGADVTLGRNEMAILHITLRNGGSERMVRKLLEKGADVTAETSSCRTVLHCAIDGGVSEKIFRLLLDKGAEVCVNTRETVDWHTPLLRAATDKHRSEREEEARNKLTLDDVLDGEGVFQKAYEGFILEAEANREAIVRELVDRGANIHEKDLAGKTSLHEVARNGYVGIVEFLLEKGADVAAKDGQEYTALHRAAEGSFMYRYKDNSGHIKVMKLLLEKGADINSTCRGGLTVRDWGSSGNKLLCDFLEELGQDVEELRAYQSDADECDVIEAFGSEGAGGVYDDYDFDIDFDNGSDNDDNDDNDNDDDDDAFSWDGDDSL